MPNPRFFKYRPQSCLGVSGPDSLEFLQGQFSNDLSSISIGEVVYGLWLNRKGKIVADSFVLRLADESFRLVSYFCEEQVIHDRLDAYLIMEEADLERSGAPIECRCVWGDDAQKQICEALGIDLPLPGNFSRSDDVVAFWGRRCGEPVLEIVILEEASLARISLIDACLAKIEAVELTFADLLELAIGSKVPLIGCGFGESDLPQELGMEDYAVSFRKGCYLGQEVMARIHAMGRVRKELRAIGIEDANTVSEIDLPIDLLDEHGKRQGQLRQVAYPDSGGIGLAVVSVGCVVPALRAGESVVSLLEERASES